MTKATTHWAFHHHQKYIIFTKGLFVSDVHKKTWIFWPTLPPLSLYEFVIQTLTPSPSNKKIWTSLMNDPKVASTTFELKKKISKLIWVNFFKKKRNRKKEKHFRPVFKQVDITSYLFLLYIILFLTLFKQIFELILSLWWHTSLIIKITTTLYLQPSLEYLDQDMYMCLL